MAANWLQNHHNNDLLDPALILRSVVPDSKYSNYFSPFHIYRTELPALINSPFGYPQSEISLLKFHRLLFYGKGKI